MLLDDARQFGRQPARGQGEVAVEIEVEGRVQEHGHEPGPARRLLGLGAPAFPLLREPQAGDQADDGPPPVEQVEQRTRAAHRLIVGMGGHVEKGR